MRPIRSLPGLVAASALIAVAAPAAAQTASREEAPRLRRLDWAGRPEAAVPVGLRRPSPVIPHAGADAARPTALRPARPWRPAPSVVDGRVGLTPASAFFGPEAAEPQVQRAPAPAPRPEAPPEHQPRPQPSTPSSSQSSTQATHVPRPEAAPPALARREPAEPQLRPREAAGQAEAAPQPAARLVQPSPVASTPAPMPTAPVEAAPLDPMAPRPDAPVFRIQGARAPQTATQPQPQAQPQPPAPAMQAPSAEAAAPPSARAPGQGARYYSVHRQAGRQPDAVAMPEQVWLDRMPVQMAETPASEDLAAPPEAPEMMRDGQGRLRPVPQRQDDVE